MNYLKESKYLIKKDKKLKLVIEQIGECTLGKSDNYFHSLCDAIVSQQLSVKAADTIFKRFLGLLDDKILNPENLIQIRHEELRAIGCSNAKAKYVINLAECCIEKIVDLENIHHLNDEEVITQLTQVKGIGRWTAEMFLMFSLNRLNVLPVDDLGIKKGFMKVYDLSEMPTKSQMNEIASNWQPYRTIGSWYLWRSLESK